MKVALIFDKKIEYTTGIYYEEVFRRKAVDFKHFWVKDTQRILPGEYDLYLRVDDGEYNYDIPEVLEPKAFWVSETHLEGPFKRLKQQLPHYDFVFSGIKEEADRLSSLGIKTTWVPGACEPSIHKRLDLEEGYDVGFVGNDGGIPRKFILQEIRERYPESFIGRADHNQISRIYSSSRIGFSYSIRQETLTFRSFEIMSCGAMLLVNALKQGDTTIEDLGFTDRKHLVIYNHPGEIFDLIEYYLRRDAERKKIAQAGHELAVSQHTYEHRIRQMFEVIHQALGDKFPLPLGERKQ